MKWMGAVLLAVAVVGLGFAVAGRAEDDPPAEGTREEQPLRPEAKSKPVDQARIRELVADLGAEDYDRREAAFRELARIGDAAAPALEEARKSDDVQMRVSAERLLRRIRRPAAPGERPRELSPDRSRVRTAEEWLRELEERGLRGIDWEEWRRLMDRRLEEMRRELEGLERELDRDLRGALRQGTVERHVSVRTDDEAIDCRVDAAGKVTVTVTKVDDGTEKATTYEAPSIEEFEKRHPEVYAKVKGFLGGDGGIRLEIRPGIRQRSFPDLRGRRWPAVPTPEPEPDAPKLGFYVGEISPALRSHLGLVPEEGLLVSEVVPGTLAERLGLRRYDVVLRVADRSVGSPEDVGEALSTLAEDAPVKVLVVRQGKRIELIEKK